MDLDGAIDAHLKASILMSAYGDPRELVDVGPLKLVRDAPGRKRDPRREQFLISGVDPAEAIETIQAYRPEHNWGLSVVEEVGADHEGLKDQYKAGGYRLLTRIPFFAYDLAKPPSLDVAVAVERVVDKSQAEMIKTAARHSQIHPSLLHAGDAPLRLYGVFSHGRALGWVRSVRTSDSATWVSNLFVGAAHRKKGIGSAIISHMLRDDAKYGAKYSFLTATNEGSKLYRRLGYEEIGLMQIFTPSGVSLLHHNTATPIHPARPSD